MKKLNKIFLWCHRWSGIAFALVFIVVGLSGTLLTFRYEIQELMTPGQLMSSTDGMQADFHAVAVAIPQQLPGAQVRFLQMNAAQPAFPMRAVVELPSQEFQVWYADPQTGDLVENDIHEDFWRMMRDLHIFLLQGTAGLFVVFASGWVLIACSVLGTWLWAPRLKKPKIALGVRWKASPKKLILDLHNVTGIYPLIPMIFLGLTGATLILARLSPTEVPTPESHPEIQAAQYVEQDSSQSALAVALNTLGYNDSELFIHQVRFPNESLPWFEFRYDDPEAGFQVGYTSQSGTVSYPGYVESDLSFWAQLKGELGVAIHEGYIWGNFGRWIVFLCGITLTFGSISGVWLWLVKRRKKQRGVSSQTMLADRA
jgi:uncharacterized iron-regulated membrane protein